MINQTITVFETLSHLSYPQFRAFTEIVVLTCIKAHETLRDTTLKIFLMFCRVKIPSKVLHQQTNLFVSTKKIFQQRRTALDLKINGYNNYPKDTKMWNMQSKVPKLPIPTLQETADRYVEFVSPLVTPEQLETTKKHIEEFTKSGGEGEKLQVGLTALHVLHLILFSGNTGRIETSGYGVSNKLARRVVGFYVFGNTRSTCNQCQPVFGNCRRSEKDHSNCQSSCSDH